MAPAKSSPERQLEGFIDKYPAAIGVCARSALIKLRAFVPGAYQLVYDNYNTLAIGFGPTDRASDAIVSIALYPRWVNLFFLNGAGLPDPQKLLNGSGARVRSIRLKDAADLDGPAVRTLIAEAVKRSAQPFDASAGASLVIKSVSEKQRPRRPA